MSATPTVPPDDLLFRLTRLLLATPEDALNAPPISRRTLAAIVSEIKLLREQNRLLHERNANFDPQTAQQLDLATERDKATILIAELGRLRTRVAQLEAQAAAAPAGSPAPEK